MAASSEDFNTALFMEEVQRYECLYNKYSKDYKNKFVRLNCWKKLGENFGLAPEGAEKKYKYMRTAYGRWLKKRKNIPSGSGRDAFPKSPPEFENLDWLATHINHKHVSIQNLPEEILVEEEDEAAVEAEADEPEPVASQYAPSDDDMSTSSPLSSTSARGPSPTVTITPVSTPARAPSPTVTSTPVTEPVKKKRVWSNQKNKQQAKQAKEDVDTVLLNTAKSIADGLKASPSAAEPQHDEESLYCQSLAIKMRQLDERSKAYLRIQIEQLMFNVQFGQVSVPVQPQGYNYAQQPTSGYHRDSTEFVDSMGERHYHQL